MSDQSNLNRNIQTTSYTGATPNSEGAHPVQLDPKNARQAVANPDMHNDGVWDASSAVSGEKELLGQGTTGEGIKDDHYPSLPAPLFAGAGGTTNAGNQGIPLDFNSIGKLKDGQFPRDSYTSTISKGAAPLT